MHTSNCAASVTSLSVSTVTRSRGRPLPVFTDSSEVSFSRTGDRILHGLHQL